jgi:hypothetical protein
MVEAGLEKEIRSTWNHEKNECIYICCFVAYVCGMACIDGIRSLVWRPREEIKGMKRQRRGYHSYTGQEEICERRRREAPGHLKGRAKRGA